MRTLTCAVHTPVVIHANFHPEIRIASLEFLHINTENCHQLSAPISYSFFTLTPLHLIFERFSTLMVLKIPIEVVKTFEMQLGLYAHSTFSNLSHLSTPRGQQNILTLLAYLHFTWCNIHFRVLRTAPAFTTRVDFDNNAN